MDMTAGPPEAGPSSDDSRDDVTRSAPLLATMLAALPFGVAAFDVPSGQVLYMNERFTRCVGHPRAVLMREGFAILRTATRALANGTGGCPFEEVFAPNAGPTTGDGIGGDIPLAGNGVEARWVRVTGRRMPLPGALGAPPLVIITADVTEESRARERVREERAELHGRVHEAETRLRWALGAAGLGMWEYDPEDDTVRADEHACNLLEAPDRPVHFLADWCARVVADDRERLIDVLRARHEPRSRSVRVRVTSPDASVRHVLIRGGPAREGDDGRLFGIVDDVTVHVLAEEVIREAHRRFVTLAENAPDVIARAGSDFRVRYVNQAAEHVLGIPLQCITGRHIHDFRDRAPEMVAAVCAVLEGRTSDAGETCEFSISRDGRSRTHLMARLVPERDESGAIVGALGVMRDITELVQVREALSESEGRYRALFDALPVPAWVYSPATLRISAFNDAAVAKYGYDVTQAMSLRADEILAPDDRPRFHSDVRNPREGRTPRGTWKHVLRGGEQIDVEISTYDTFLDGEPQRVVVANDVTAHLAAERELARSNENLEREVEKRTVELRALLAQLRREVARREGVEDELRARERSLVAAERIAHLGRWELDRDTRALRPSSLAQELTGMREGRLRWTWRVIRGFVDPQDRPLLRCARRSILTGDGTVDCVCRFVHPARGVRWFRILAEPRLDAAGAIVGSAGTIQDITDRMLLQRQLEERSVFLREIIDNIPAFIAVKGRDCRLQVVNRSYAELFGSTADAIERAGDVDYAAIGIPLGLRDEDEEVFSSRRPVLRSNVAVVDAEGSMRMLEGSKRLFTVPGSPAPFLLAVSVDVTQQRQLEQQHREMEKLVATGRMAARVAHEINNPLGGIQNAFQLLKQDIPTESPRFHYVGRIEREVARIAGIVRQMFDLYRPEGPVERLTDVEELIDDIRHLLESQLRQKGLSLDVALRHRRSQGRVVGSLMRPVLFNLVQNAIEASPDDSRIRIEVKQCDEFIDIDVIDSGPGIPENLMARVFEPFFTTKSGIATGGLGLGLAIARSSVEAMGGSITLRRGGSGGAAFVVRVPTRREDPSPHHA